MHHILPFFSGRLLALRFPLQSRRLVEQLLDVLLHRSALEIFAQEIAKVFRILNVVVTSDAPRVLILVNCLLEEVFVADAHILEFVKASK